MKARSYIVILILAALLSLLKLRVDAGAWVNGIVNNLARSWSLLLVFLHVFVSIILLLLCALKNRVAAYALLPYVILMWCIELYIRLNYGYVDFAEQVTAFMGTSWQELTALISTGFVCGSVLIIAVLVSAIWCLRRFVSVLPTISAKQIAGIFLLYVTLSTGTVLLCAAYAPEILLPTLYGRTVNKLSREQKESCIAEVKNNTSPLYLYRILIPYYRQLGFPYYIAQWYMPSRLAKAEEKDSCLIADMPEDATIVLVIGESYRSDHASWNGYHRETLPQTSAHKNNIINFPFFASYATSTISSIYGIITDATCEQREAKSTSFVGLMKKHGYNTHLLLSRTTHWEYNPSIHTAFDNKIDATHELHNSTELINKVSAIASLPGKKLIIIEDGCGHAPYDHEPQFSQFGSSGKANYDNALLQVDDYLNGIITKLSNHHAALLYTSDHGQSFGEQGCFMHGGALTIEKQRHVFSFLWASDSYTTTHTNLLHNVRSNSHKYLTHGDVYYSILSLGGIECQTPEAEMHNFTKPLPNRPTEQHFRLKE